VVECRLIAAVFDRLALLAGSGSEHVIAPERVADLRGYLDRVPDPRVRHSVGSLLVLTAAAVMIGARSCAAIGERIADVPQWALAVLGVRFDARRDPYLAPESAVRRLAQQVDGDLLETAITVWLSVGHTTDQADAAQSAAPTVSLIM
jgi:hypothetical protein